MNKDSPQRHREHRGNHYEPSAPRDEIHNSGFSKLLSSFFIPFCIWGMMSSLVLHLIEVRSLFIAGGENRLRLAAVSFALGIILVQRLTRVLGPSYAKAYGVALGAAITLFVAYFAWAYLLPVPPLIVFLVNEAIFGVLWFVGHKITAACWVDSPLMEATAAETGIFSREKFLKRALEAKKEERLRAVNWMERLPRNHPGRVILYFSMFAIPAFGVAVHISGAEGARMLLRMGIYLFIYLWCAFSLLFLSGLSRLASYFEKRSVSLPERLGLSWLAIGFLVVTFAIILAVFLPQPPTIPGLYVRTRIESVYRGLSREGGMKDSVRSGEGKAEANVGNLKQWKLDRDTAINILEKRASRVDQLKDPFLSDIYRNTGFEPEYRNTLVLVAASNEAFSSVFGVVLKVILVLALCAALVIGSMVLMSAYTGVKQSIPRWRRKKKVDREQKRKEIIKRLLEHPAALHFCRFLDPFAGGTRRDGDALVRYLWEAMLAYCADYGTPCPVYKTPFEFVEEKPDALEGFEDNAEYIARMFTFSEYSGEKVSDDEIPRLKKFWSELRQHAQLSDV